MRRSIRLAAVMAAALLVLPAATVRATPSMDVELVVPTTIPADGGPTFGPFTASGAAVEAGLVCPAGQTVDVFGRASAFRSPVSRGINFQVVKLFTCDDGSGQFLVKLQVRIDAKGDNFTWVMMGGSGGSGDYERLRGTGMGVGYPIDAGVLDTYEGGLHVD